MVRGLFGTATGREDATLRACWLVDFAPAPSQAVSSGPKMVALQTNRLSSLWGLALHPCRRESCFGRRRSAERSGASARGSFSRPAASGTRVAREGRPSAVRGGRCVSVGARGMRTHVRRLGLDGLQVGLQPEHGGRLLARRARHGPLGSNFRVSRGEVGLLLARLGLSARV